MIGPDPRLSVNALSSRSWTLRQDLDCYERLGIERITVNLPKLLDPGLDDAVADHRLDHYAAAELLLAHVADDDRPRDGD